MADAPPPPPPPPLQPEPLPLPPLVPPWPSQNPNCQSQILSLILPHHASSVQPPPPPPEPPSPSHQLFSLRKRPPIRVTSEFNSDSSVFFHKVSSKIFDGIAKLKFSFQNNVRGHIANPQIGLFSKFLAITCDVGSQNALVQGVFGVGNLLLTAVHNVKARQGELTMVANLSEPGYSFVLASPIPCVHLPNATLKFPCGEVSLQEKQDDEEKRILSVSGIVIGPVLHGGCTALYNDGSLNIRYSYKLLVQL